jgi:hypothetical protein
MKQLCTKCNGRGWLFIPPDGEEKCPKCKGVGEVDWVEQMVGVKKRGILIPPGVYVREVDLSAYIDIDKSICDGKEVNPYIILDRMRRKNEYFKKL